MNRERYTVMTKNQGHQVLAVKPSLFRWRLTMYTPEAGVVTLARGDEGKMLRELNDTIQRLRIHGWVVEPASPNPSRAVW